ncbi:glycosyltransferase family 25 protein [Robbsia sp. Bb-Pol-6]|uniref:Glycosyltransferase family 25 protein n=2 Tax=Robbsia betulipollinis TaxID=2981849 RepID=A0ABT3ZIC7_9BURK|nr:glycosyltransferase family 25 protein [Robbsia betulipollinis]MCY0386284.1 glycosyltransferase family 25 protein [Robbsia betulipollinis]
MLCKTAYICISLPGALERRAFMKEQFSRLKIPARFFDAIGIRPGSVDRIPGYDSAKRLHRFGYGLTPGEIGCYLSHRAVWRRFLDSDSDVCCVLEDDGVLHGDFSERVADIVMARAHWDFVRLYSLYRRGARPYCVTAGSRQLNWVACSAMSTLGYLLTRSAAEKLLIHTQDMMFTIDEVIDRHWEHGLRLLGDDLSCRIGPAIELGYLVR